ncbi:MAG: DUF3997 domain-containing protein [Flavisolibacter sp.]|nr:DUF3997 domain-containing protein [Flavisolibacter sp.]
MKRTLIVLLPALLLSGCFGLFDSDFEEIDQNFNIGWIDLHMTRTICYHSQGDMGGEQVVTPFIFAYGQNRNFIVAKQHPTHDDEVDKSITHYYIIRKNQTDFDKTEDVYGPFTQSEFERKLKTLKVEAIEFEKEYH